MTAMEGIPGRLQVVLAACSTSSQLSPQKVHDPRYPTMAPSRAVEDPHFPCKREVGETFSVCSPVQVLGPCSILTVRGEESAEEGDSASAAAANEGYVA